MIHLLYDISKRSSKFIGVDVCEITHHYFRCKKKRERKKYELSECKRVYASVVTTTEVVKKSKCVKCQEK